MMIIDCISDLHGHFPKLEGGDLLIVAGDLTARDLPEQHADFNCWIADLPYKKKVFIGGNHDGYIEKNKGPIFDLRFNVQYLCDSDIEFEGLKIWGSPWTPEFCNWHFMLERGEEIKKKWDLIPFDTDILITHGPPYGILDQSEYGNRCGCEELWKKVKEIRPKLHVFGHIHEGYGQFQTKYTKFVNASIMNKDYDPVNNLIRIEL